MPRARLRVLDCADTVPFHAGDVAAVLEEAEAFVIGHEDSPWTDRVLATVLSATPPRSTPHSRPWRRRPVSQAPSRDKPDGPPAGLDRPTPSLP